MKARTALVGLAAAGILAGTVGTAHAAHGAGDTTVALNGANEVGTPGDRNGSGKIEISFFGPGGNTPAVAFPGEYYLCYDLETRNIDDVVGAHVHEVDRGPGEEDANPRKLTGGVVVDLLGGDVVLKDGDGNVTDDADEAATSCVTGAEGVIEEILEDPAEYYVNVHTDAHPQGAVRGQLHTIR